jgi:nucleotide-binding universal stress UspA family protein
VSDRVLLAVADSPAALRAARVAVELAARLGGEVRAVHVVPDGDVSTLISAASTHGDLTHRRDAAAVSVLRHVTELAGRAGVPATTVQCNGDVGTCILREAEAWEADVIVLGRTTRRGTGQPVLSGDAQRVLEFADRPVLVVPGAGTPA